MAYNQSIPLGPDQYFVSQGDILDNFQAIFQVTGVNHSDLTTALVPNADQGKHNSLTMPEQAADQVTLAGEVGSYSKNVVYNLGNQVVEWFYREESSGNIIGITEGQATTLNMTFFGNVAQNLMRLYWNKLPSGLLIKSITGTFNVNASNSSSISEDTIFIGTGVAFNNVYMVHIYPHRDPFVDPSGTGSGTGGDPNIVINVTSWTNTQVNFTAITRNLFDTARTGAKRHILMRILIFGN